MLRQKMPWLDVLTFLAKKFFLALKDTRHKINLVMLNSQITSIPYWDSHSPTALQSFASSAKSPFS